MIHVIFGSTTASGLKYALSEQDLQIIGFPIDFYIGPITNFHQSSGINNYFSWLKTSYQPVWNLFVKDRPAYQQSLKQLSEIKNGEQVTIWTCKIHQSKSDLESAVGIVHSWRDGK